MSLKNIVANLELDVYNHDSGQPTIKAIALDDNTRYAAAMIRYRGEPYNIGEDATVELIIIRPDKVGVLTTGSSYELPYDDPSTEEIEVIYGAYAELDQAAIAVSGELLGQFRITSGGQILRTQTFKIKNGKALDDGQTDWAGEYEGHNLDEMAVAIDSIRTATQSDAGKALKAKTVTSGKVTEWEFGDIGSDIFIEKATDNLFNKSAAVTGSYINTYTGEIVEYNGVFHEFIEFEAGTYTFFAQQGVFGGNAYVVPIFDENRNIVSYTEGSHTEIDNATSIVTVTLSSQAAIAGKYFGVNGTTDILDTLMVVKGYQYPASYIPYGTYKTIEGLQISKSQIVDLDDEVNPLKGKIVSFNGDSIAAGAGYAGGYGKIIAENNEMTYENIAVGGGTMAYVGANVHCISRTIANMRSDADYVILDGGGNDADGGVPLGALTTGYTATLDDTTFAGAFEQMLKTAIARFPNKKIGYVFIHKCAYLFSSSVKDSYYDIAKAACEKWGIPYCDLNTQTPPLNYIDALKTAYTSNGDGYHPNEQGYKLFYVPKITAWMKTL